MQTRVLVVWIVCTIAACGGDDGPSRQIDAAPTIDANPACAAANSYGGFPDCTVCTAAGTGCDTIDVNGQTSKVCDCSGVCPCGFHCGSIEIAPGIFTDNECIR